MSPNALTDKSSKIHSNKIKAVIFDIDGTLYSNLLMLVSAPFIYIRHISWIMHFAKMRKKLRAYLRTTQLENNSFESDKSTGNYNWDIDTLHCKSSELFSEEIKLPVDISDYILEKRIYRAWIDAIKRVPLRIGMRKILSALSKNNIKVGILSDFRAIEKITHWGIENYFSVIECAEDYGTLKPDKRIFLLTCEKLGVSPEETVYVGNHLKYDGIGAASIGLTSFLYYKNIFHRKSLKEKYNIDSFVSTIGLYKQLKKHKLL